MGDYIAVAVIVLVLSAAITYIIIAKKKGVKCIGCPSGCKGCSGKNGNYSCCCECSNKQDIDKTE